MATKNQSSPGSDRGTLGDRGATAGDRQAGGTVEQLREKAGDVKQNLQEMGALAREAAQEKVGELREAAQQKVGELRDSVGEYYDRGRERASDLERSVEAQIREKPLTSMLMAAGVGVLVGILWMRR